MKKIIVGIFAIGIFIVAGHQAYASWNTYPSDCPLPLSIGNYSTSEGIRDGSNGCWTKTNVSADAGQTINVAVYYDNTNNTSANNAVIHLTQSPSGSMTNPSSNFSFSGNLSSSAGSLNLSQVTASLSSAQTLTFSQAKWYKAASQNGISLPNGQTGYEAFNGGLNLGTINSGDWGTIIFSFSVGTTVQNQTCQDPTANNYGGSLPCTHTQYNNCTISNFTGNGSTTTNITSGASVNLAWNTVNCSYVTISGPNYNSNGNLGTNSSLTVYPYIAGSYILTAYGSNGQTQTQTVYVTINNTQYNNCTISNFTGNGSTSTNIQPGGLVNLSWNTFGCTSVNISGPNLPYNNQGLSGNQPVYPSVSGSYILTAYGNNGGIQTQTVYINVNSIIYNQPPIYVPPVYVPPYQPPVYVNSCAVTTVATNVTQNSATLNGLLTNSTGASYFEYGTSVDLGSRTTSRFGSGSYNEVVSGLSPNTIYYFRFDSQCQTGLSFGKIEIFRTQGAINTVQTVRQVIVQGTTVVGTESPIMLKIENRYQSIGAGDMIDYTVTYKNIGRSLLTHPVLQVVVPQGITLTNSSAGTYSNDTNTLTVQLNDLRPGDEGVVYLQARVDTITSNTAQVVTTAILVYTSPNGAQENAIAYVLNTPKEFVNNLGASAFWSGLWNMGIIGWLLLIILILLIILLTRRYYGTRSVVRTVTPSGNTHTTTTNY